MGSHGLGVPGPALFLLLVLWPPLMKAGSLQHNVRGSRDLHGLSLSRRTLLNHFHPDGAMIHHLRGHYPFKSRIKETTHSCQSSYDLYFILDKSGSVNNNWMDIYNLVEDLLKKFENPNMRISFITYSTEGHTVMKLTSDVNEIRDGLSRLRNTVPTGATNMQEGFKKANEQIRQANSGGNKVSSMIISLTDGTLMPEAFEETKSEAAKSRNMGSTVYVIGVKDYMKDQLLEIADSPQHVLGVEYGFKELKHIVEPLLSKLCIEITSVEPSSLCAGEDYQVMISGKGFNNAVNQEEVICRFRFSDNKFFDKKANTVDKNTITCPGVMIEKPDKLVHVEVSLNNAISFIKSNANITAKTCVSIRNVPPEEEGHSSLPLSPPPSPGLPEINPLSLFSAINPFYLLGLLTAGLILLCLFFCFCRCCCCNKPCREPPMQKIILAPVKKCVQPCPVIAPCKCRGGRIRRIEGKLDNLCDFVQSCNQVPLMWCQPRYKRRFFNFARLRPPCLKYPCAPKICLPPCAPEICLPPCAPKICLPPCAPKICPSSCAPKLCLTPSRACFPISSCCSCYQTPLRRCPRLPSRMLPLMAPSAPALCGATLSLPPP